MRSFKGIICVDISEFESGYVRSAKICATCPTTRPPGAAHRDIEDSRLVATLSRATSSPAVFNVQTMACGPTGWHSLIRERAGATRCALQPKKTAASRLIRHISERGPKMPSRAPAAEVRMSLRWPSRSSTLTELKSWAFTRAVITFGILARHARLSSAAKAAVARLIGTDGAEEINLAKCRPQHIRKVELTVHALPKQEA